jgi:8-oxo-dGTP pyrophosphatase MutT (NUDIX family)
MGSVEIREAATVVVARDTAAGPEVLMLRRHVRLDFIGDAYVFPGGAVDADDGEVALSDLSAHEAEQRLGIAGARAYYVAAIREIFEESGLLLATRQGRELVESDLAVMEAARVRLNARACRFADIVAEFDLELRAAALVYFAHWVTPVGPPRRYDTRFFMVEAPAGQGASHDGEETVSSLWVTPTEALERHDRGELEMIFPTIATLRQLAAFPTVAAMRAHLSGLTIPRLEPVLVERDGKMVPELPEA